MKVPLLVLILLLLAWPAGHADVLYLKDGSKIKGEVTQMDESEVKIILPYGTLAVKRQDVLRIDLGDQVREPPVYSPPEEPVEEEKEPVPDEKPEAEPEPDLELTPGPVKPRTKKAPNTAAMLAIIPGGGYGYLERWDLAFAAAGLELGLAGLGMSLVSDEGEGKNSTGYVILGFLGLLKVAEVIDSRDRAVEWNKLLDSEENETGPPGKGP